MQLAKRLLFTEEYYFSKKLREIEQLNASGKQVINLGIGSPDLPPHPAVISTLKEYAEMPQTHGYQNYKGIQALREGISTWYKRYYGVDLDPNSEILPLMGSKEGIVHICMTYLEEGCEALIPNPGYPTYASAVRLTGAKAVTYDLKAENGWLPDLKKLEESDLSKVKLMWINYPHMPTGTQATQEFFEELVSFAKRNQILICHDNPYSFILNENPTSILAVPGAKEVCLELNSLSKSSNMAGWRVGMLSGNAERIQEVLRFKSNMDSGMFYAVQMAAVTALNLDKSWYAELNSVYKERQKLAFSMLNHLGCKYDHEQVGLFVWGKIPEKYKSAYELSDEILNEAHVFITPGGIFGEGGNDYIRISLCGSTETFKRAMQRIEEIKE